MINMTDLVFTDITSEKYRVYDFGDGKKVRIKNPTHLAVSDNGHRVLDAKNRSHYIRNGWLEIKWEPKPGQPNFVK